MCIRDRLNAGPLLGLKGMPVLVQGNGGVGVAQQLREGHRVHPLLQSSGGKGMAQRMKIGAGDARSGHASLEKILIGSGLIGLSILLTKDVTTGIVARILLHDGELDLPVPGQLLIKFITEIDNASGMVGLCG